MCQFGGTCRKYLRKRRLKKGENQWEKKWAERNDEQQKRNLQRKESFWDRFLQNMPETTDEPSLLISLHRHHHHSPSNQRSPTFLSEQVKACFTGWMLALTQMSFATTHYLNMDNRGNLPGGWSWKDTFMVTCLIPFDFTLTEVFGHEGWIWSQLISIGSN